MNVDTSRKGLVRGYVVYGQWRTGCISLERAKDDNCLECGVAYTFWHSHDDDPKIVEGELRSLEKCYTSFKEWDGIMIGFEYRDYSH